MEKIRASTNHNKISDSLWNLKGLTCVLTIIIQLRDCMFHKLFEEEGKTVPKQKWLNIDDPYLHTLEVDGSNCDSLHEGKWELNVQLACIQGNIQMKWFDPQ